MQFTPTTLMAATSDVLTASGFRTVAFNLTEQWGTSNCRLFEDPYSLVAVAVFDTWIQLQEHWPEAQASLVAFVASTLARSEAKAWDIYLAVLTPAFADTASARELNAIRYDTTRVRKLISTGEELRTLDDIRRTLLPLLPISPVTLEPPRDVFELLIEALANNGINEKDVRNMVEAFVKNEDLISSLGRGDDEA